MASIGSLKIKWNIQYRNVVRIIYNLSKEMLILPVSFSYSVLSPFFTC